MARIVIVHGAFNELWGPNELKARWLPAVRDGLWHHGVEIDADDVDVCFYGDLFRHHPGTAADRKLEQSRAGVADMLADLGGDAVAGLAQAAGEATFDRTVDLATAMLTEPDLHDKLRARIEAEISDDTRVLVAHSLGTVLSYGTLALHDDWPVHTFVTLGSPLAVPMVFNSLEPAPVDGLGVWPGSVQRWVNVRATQRQGLRDLPDRPLRAAGRRAGDRQRAPRSRARALSQLEADWRRHRSGAGNDDAGLRDFS